MGNYGRKVEEAMKRQKMGQKILIVKEENVTFNF
jgi:hypothetical protein